MINKIKKRLGFNNQYINLKQYQKSFNSGLRLYKPKLNKINVCVGCLIIGIAIITPFTNIFLIPLGLWVLKKPTTLFNFLNLRGII